MQENGIMDKGTTENSPFRVMESMLSSIKLQMNARYFTYLWRSNWARSIFYLSQTFGACGMDIKGEYRELPRIGMQLVTPRQRGSKADESRFFWLWPDELKNKWIKNPISSSKIKHNRNDVNRDLGSLRLAWGNSAPRKGWR